VSVWGVTLASFVGQSIMGRKRKGEPNLMVIYGTLCYVINGKRLLMLKKAAGLFGEGKWNGLGGKIEAKESPEQACIREVYEESGLHVSNLKYHGALRFWFGNTNELTFPTFVYVFSSKSFEGQLKESPEGILCWVDFDKIPYEEMWEDDRHWLPMLIEGKSFKGKFYFNQEGNKLLNHKLEAL